MKILNLVLLWQVATNENTPYVYYSPNYGYGQSPFNPYNPYIPGAVVGADGSIIPAQQFYALPSYEDPATSASYLPVVFQPRPDVVANGFVDSFIDTGGSFNKADGLGSKRNSAQNTPNSSLSAMGDASGRKNSFVKTSEGRVNVGTGKQHPSSNTSGSITSQAAPQISQVSVHFFSFIELAVSVWIVAIVITPIADTFPAQFNF